MKGINANECQSCVVLSYLSVMTIDKHNAKDCIAISFSAVLKVVSEALLSRLGQTVTMFAHCKRVHFN